MFSTSVNTIFAPRAATAPRRTARTRARRPKKRPAAWRRRSRTEKHIATTHFDERRRAMTPWKYRAVQNPQRTGGRLVGGRRGTVPTRPAYAARSTAYGGVYSSEYTRSMSPSQLFRPASRAHARAGFYISRPMRASVERGSDAQDAIIASPYARRPSHVRSAHPTFGAGQTMYSAALHPWIRRRRAPPQRTFCAYRRI